MPIQLSLETWEALCPLSEAESSSVVAVKNAAERIPLPAKYTDEEIAAASSTPTLGFSGGSTPQLSRPSTPLPSRLGPGRKATANGNGTGGEDGLIPLLPIQTPQQFYDWHTIIDTRTTHAQESHIRAHISTLQSHLTGCQTLLSLLSTISMLTSQMIAEQMDVSRNSEALQLSSARMLEERDMLEERVEEIEDVLEYFRVLDGSVRMLSLPGEDVALELERRGGEFGGMVERVDLCIQFLREHVCGSSLFNLRLPC
jgi:conserved oligomeric Golgi complex subunit 3